MHIRADAPRIVALVKVMHERGTILDATLLPFLNEAEHRPQKVGAGIAPWSYAVTLTPFPANGRVRHHSMDPATASWKVSRTTYRESLPWRRSARPGSCPRARRA